MKASILALTISATLSATAFASTTQVDVQAANSATSQLIGQQMQGIDASIQAQLDAKYADAKPGKMAIIDDVVYEKESTGTWAAVGTASAAVVAGLLSGSSSSSDTNDAPIPTLPVHAEPNNDLPEYGNDRPELDPTQPDNNLPEYGGERPELDPTKPGYNGVEFDRVSDTVINVTKNGIPMGSLYTTEGEWYYASVGGGEPIHITKDLVNGKPPLEVDPTKPGYDGVEFDRVSDSVINVTKNGIPMGSLYTTEGEWYYASVGG
ncbi:hypothetical protein VHA01S_042_00010, partial [Vibrio halioticoli NBRC 102217]